jgi:DNA-binding response OmpR family regulator
MTMTRTASVLIADGDARYAAEIAAAMQRTGYSTIEVGTGTEALDVARDRRVDLLVLEVTLTDMAGYEVCRILRAEGDEVPIFFLSGTHTDSADRVAGLLLGADDYLVKPFDSNELVARAHRHIWRRGRGLRLKDDSAPILTRREGEILALLALGRTQKEIGQELSISPKTAGTHIQSLFGKFDVHSRAVLVARAYMLGLAGPRAHDGSTRQPRDREREVPLAAEPQARL